MSALPSDAGAPVLLSVRGLRVHLAGGAEPLVGPLDFELARGACLGLIGESGSGKSLSVLALLGLLPPGLSASGELQWEGSAIAIGSPAQRALRGRAIAWMPQDPQAALHPLRRVGDQLIESLRVLRGLDRSAARAEAMAQFAALDLPQPAQLLARYPHQLSGGQRQRVGLALALAGAPRLLLADEPTSALDPDLAQDLLVLLAQLRAERGLAVVLVSHDLPLVGRHADAVAILQRGRVVEAGPTRRVFAAPQAEYTRELLAADRLPEPTPAVPGAPLLEVSGLGVRYPRSPREAVSDVDVVLHQGECLALIGGSGSGKSSLGRAVLRLFRRGVRGQVRFEGEDLLAAGPGRLRRLRGRIGVVFQDPYASLDPRHRIAEIVGEPLRIHGPFDPIIRRARIAEVLAEVGLGDPDVLDRYPHQFSGGQRQRIAIARALACRPSLLLCDEAVSALDARHRADVLALLARLKAEQGLALLFITHDWEAARTLADRVAVMQDGRVVRQGAAGDILGCDRAAGDGAAAMGPGSGPG